MITNNTFPGVHREYDKEGNEIDLVKREALIKYLEEHAQELHNEIEAIEKCEDEENVEEDIARMYGLMDKEDALQVVIGLVRKSILTPPSAKLEKYINILDKYINETFEQFDELNNREKMDGEGIEIQFAARIRDAVWILKDIE